MNIWLYNWEGSHIHLPSQFALFEDDLFFFLFRKRGYVMLLPWRVDVFIDCLSKDSRHH